MRHVIFLQTNILISFTLVNMHNEDKLKFGIMGVYKIINTRTQKFYIGSSKGIRKTAGGCIRVYR